MHLLTASIAAAVSMLSTTAPRAAINAGADIGEADLLPYISLIAK